MILLKLVTWGLPQCFLLANLIYHSFQKNSVDCCKFNIITPKNSVDCCKFNIITPTALKGCQAIVFTHAVWMGGWGGWREKVCPGCISETVRCRKLILGRDIG